HLDGGRLALCCSRGRSVLPTRGGLVDELGDDGSDRHRCSHHGDLAARKAGCVTASLRSWQSVHQRTVPAIDGRSWRQLFDEPLGQCLGQRRNGELLLVAEDREGCTQNVSDTKRGQGRCVRLHRALLQSQTTSLDDRLYEPYGVRDEGRISLSTCHPNRGQLKLNFRLKP